MSIVPLSLSSGSTPARHGHAGDARLINCYIESVGEEAKASWNLHAVDGLDNFVTMPGPAGQIRAMLALTDTALYAWAGNQLFKVDQGGSSTLIGAMSTTGHVDMARNRQVPPVICSVSDGIVTYCQDDVLTVNTDADLPPAISMTSLDGYFVFLTQDGRHFASEQDATDVTALSFASAEANPDAGVKIHTRGRDLCIYGTRSTEFWANQGEDPYPFGRTTAIDVGCLAAGSVCSVDQTSAFVAHDGTVRILEGYQAQRISTHAVERFISDEDPGDLRASSWQRNGHVFYALSGLTGTWVYDVLTGKWHERKSYGLERWRCGSVTQFGRRIICGDATDAKLYDLIETPTVVAPSNGRLLMMDFSDDGGASWSTQMTASLGVDGDRLRTVRFNRLGVGRSRTYRLSFSAGSEAGNDLVSIVQTAPVHGYPYRFRHNALHVDVVPGIAATSGEFSIVSASVNVDRIGI